MFVAPQRYAMKRPIERRKSMSKNVDTICVQGGYQPGNGESRTPPIIQATTFKYKSSEQMSRLFDLSESGYFYTRLPNQRHHRGENLRNGRRRGRNADLIRPGGKLFRTLQHL